MKKKKKIILLSTLSIIFLIVLCVIIRMHYASLQYEHAAIPNIQANDLKSLTTKLMNNQESFHGSVQIKYLDTSQDMAEVTIQNNTTNDDSISAVEYRMIAEKIGQKWIITDNKTRWKCARNYLFNSWTIKACP